MGGGSALPVYTRCTWSCGTVSHLLELVVFDNDVDISARLPDSLHPAINQDTCHAVTTAVPRMAQAGQVRKDATPDALIPCPAPSCWYFAQRGDIEGDAVPHRLVQPIVLLGGQPGVLAISLRLVFGFFLSAPSVVEPGLLLVKACVAEIEVADTAAMLFAPAPDRDAANVAEETCGRSSDGAILPIPASAAQRKTNSPMKPPLGR